MHSILRMEARWSVRPTSKYKFGKFGIVAATAATKPLVNHPFLTINRLTVRSNRLAKTTIAPSVRIYHWG